MVMYIASRSRQLVAIQVKTSDKTIVIVTTLSTSGGNILVKS